MTPAINVAKKSRINYAIHHYQHDPTSDSYGLEAAEKLQVEAAQVFKTLVVCLNTKQLVVAIIPVSCKLNMKCLAKAVGAKKAEMAKQADVERSTGYILGGVSPLGQKKKLQTIIDCTAQNYPTMYVSAGKRGLEIELSANDLKKLLNATFVDISQASVH